MSRFILGNGNTVNPDVTGVALINCHDMTIDSTYENTTILNSGALEVDADGYTTALIKNRSIVITASQTIPIDYPYEQIFINANSGNIDLTIEEGGVMRWYIRTDGSVNTVTLTPSLGTINGDVNHTMLQYEKISIISDTTNLFF